MHKVLCLLPTLMVLVAGHAVAETITWDAGVKEAANSNSELNAAKSTLRSTEYQVGVARSGFLPTVTANAGYSYDSTNDPRYFSTSVTATENLFSGFSDKNKLDRARYNQSSSEASLQTVKAKVSYDLKTAFMGLLYSQKYIALTEDIIKRREANLRLVQLRFESGRENIGSLNLSKAYLAQAKFDHLQAVNSLEIYQSQLANVLGREDYMSLSVEGVVPLSTPPEENNRLINYKDLVKDTPDFKKAYFEELASSATLDLNKSTFYPTLSLSETAGRTGREYNSPTGTWAIGATLTFPLFSGGKDYYTYKSASEDYRTSVLNKKNIEETTVTGLKSAYTKYVEAQMKLDVDNAFVLASSSRERIAKEQYNNGLITFTDWDQIENDLITRQKTILQTQRDRVTAEAAWEQAQGKGVIP